MEKPLEGSIDAISCDFVLVMHGLIIWFVMYDRIQEDGIILMSVYDSYQLYEIIGHGSSCTVKRAIRKDSQQVFAAKLYEADYLSAKNQIEMLVKLDHPNIVNIYEVFEEEDCIILILQYMQGGELYDYIGQKESITQQQVRYFTLHGVYEDYRGCYTLLPLNERRPQGHQAVKSTPHFQYSRRTTQIGRFRHQCLLLTAELPSTWLPKYGRERHTTARQMCGVLESSCTTCSVALTLSWEILRPLEKGSCPTSCPSPRECGLKFFSYQAIDLLRKLLQKEPKRRFSAIQATGHIWFSYIQPVYTSAECSQQQSDQPQLKLIQSVRKIRRYNLKRKVRKTNQKLKSLMSFQSLKYSHQQFIKQESSSPSFVSSTEAEDSFGGRDSIKDIDMQIEFAQC